MAIVDEERLLQSARHLRIVLQCRDTSEATLSENLAFAFARDAGLRGIEVWYVAACASWLARHLVMRGGGELEMRVADAPRLALELRATDDGPPLETYAAELRQAQRYADDLRVGWHVSAGSIVTARKWLAHDPALARR
jgi:hypothetical protein